MLSFQAFWSTQGSLTWFLRLLYSLYFLISVTEAQVFPTTTIFITTHRTFTSTQQCNANNLPFCERITWNPSGGASTGTGSFAFSQVSTISSTSLTSLQSSTILSSASFGESTSSSTTSSTIPGNSPFYIQTEFDGSDLFFQFSGGQVVLAPETPSDSSLSIPLLEINNAGFLHQSGNPEEIVFLRPNPTLLNRGFQLNKRQTNSTSSQRDACNVLHGTRNETKQGDLTAVFFLDGNGIYLRHEGAIYEYYRQLRSPGAESRRRQNPAASIFDVFMAVPGFNVPAGWERLNLVVNRQNPTSTGTNTQPSASISGTNIPSTSISSGGESTNGQSTTGGITTGSDITISTNQSPSSTPTDAYDIITSDGLQNFCSSLLSYSPSISTAISTSISTSTTISIVSTTSTSSTTTSTTPFAEIETLTSTTTSTSLATTVSDFTAPSPVRNLLDKRQIPSKLSTYDLTSLSSACSRAIPSPPIPSTTTTTTPSLTISTSITTDLSSTLEISIFTAPPQGTTTTTFVSTVSTDYAYAGYLLKRSSAYKDYALASLSSPSLCTSTTCGSTVGFTRLLFESDPSTGYLKVRLTGSDNDPWYLTVKDPTLRTTSDHDLLEFTPQSFYTINSRNYVLFVISSSFELSLTPNSPRNTLSLCTIQGVTYFYLSTAQNAPSGFSDLATGVGLPVVPIVALGILTISRFGGVEEGLSITTSLAIVSLITPLVTSIVALLATSIVTTSPIGSFTGNNGTFFIRSVCSFHSFRCLSSCTDILFSTSSSSEPTSSYQLSTPPPLTPL
ncbi:hypothetical protein TWF281_002880 [Arthrobotrys megalospora]